MPSVSPSPRPRRGARRARGLLGLGLLAGACTPDQSIIKLEGDDVFFQNDAGEVDVLVVVDNSGSMQPYQELLSQNFNEFLTYFIEGNVDYHIGVVTTTIERPEGFLGAGCSQDDIDAIPEGGQLVRTAWISPSTDDGDALFQELVSVGTCGAGYEMGIESAYRAVTDPMVSGDNEGFLRDDAYLSIIFVSDEEDSSPQPVNDYINAFRDVKGQRARDVFNASALVVTSLDDCDRQQVQSGASPGTRYLDVAEQTGGVIGNICADDFGVIVEELSLASSRLTDTFFLNDEPDPRTIEVGVEEDVIPCDAGVWTFARADDNGVERPAIVFDRGSLPPPNSKITIQYSFGGGDPAGFCEG